MDLPGVARLSGEETGSIRIVRLAPKDGVTLARGAHVSIAATVAYELRGERDTVSLVVQGQAHKSLLDTFPSQSVAERSGQVTLQCTFTVPEDATRIDVFLPLSRPGAATTTVASARYAVEPRKEAGPP